MDSFNSQASPIRAPRWKFYLPILLWIVASVCAISFFRDLPWTSKADHRDFDIYYSTASLLRHGIDPHAVDTPSWLLCFEPLTLLSRFAAYKLWFFINIFALAISLILLLRDSTLAESDKWTLAALMILYPPIACNFWFGQSEIIVLLLLVLFVRGSSKAKI